MLETSSAIAMSPFYGPESSPALPTGPCVPRVATLGMQHLPCFAEMTSEAFTTTNQRAFYDKTAQSALVNNLRYPKAVNNEGRDRFPVVEASNAEAKVVGGANHFTSAYRRFFDNPESHLFPTDFKKAGRGDLQSPSRGSSRILGNLPPTFQSRSQEAFKEFDEEFLFQHPLNTSTSSRYSSLTQDRCYRTAPPAGLAAPKQSSLGDKFAYIRDGTGGYVVADVTIDPVAFKASKEEHSQAHDHMFGAVQVADEAALGFSESSNHVAPRRTQNLPAVSSGFRTSYSSAFKDPNLEIQTLNDVAQQRTAAFISEGSVSQKRELAFTLPGIFHRINGIPTIVREKEFLYQMRVAKGQIRTPPRAKVTSISLEHVPFSVAVPPS